MVDLPGNLARVRSRIEKAASRAGTNSSDITLVAVAKKQPAGYVSAAIQAGITDIGENYVLEATRKRQELDEDDLAGVRWHLIGHLQTNKVRESLPAFDLIQSIDSIRLAEAVSRAAFSEGVQKTVLLQVHLGEESTKTGFAPATIREIVSEASALQGLSVIGLMGIAPRAVEPRPFFRELKRLFDDLDEKNRQILSMGMSSDFETAIEEGANLIRVGTAIFGERVK